MTLGYDKDCGNKFALTQCPFWSTSGRAPGIAGWRWENCSHTFAQVRGAHLMRADGPLQSEAQRGENAHRAF